MPVSAGEQAIITLLKSIDARLATANNLALQGNADIAAIKDDVAELMFDVARIEQRVPPAQPGPLTITVTGGSSMIQYEVHLPALDPAVADVTSRELTTVIDGGAPKVESVTPDVTTIPGEAGQGLLVSLSLVDIDDAGNRSLPSVHDFTAQDTLPPPQPGQLVVAVTGET